MARGGKRLPLVGDPASQAPAAWPLEPAPPPTELPSIAIVRGHAGAADGFAELLEGALRARGTEVTRLRVEIGIEAEPTPAGAGVLRAAPSRMLDAVTALLASAPASGVLLLEGVAFVSTRRATLSVLIDAGAGPLSLDEPVRAVRDRFDLILPEPRAQLALELAARFSAACGSAAP